MAALLQRDYLDVSLHHPPLKKIQACVFFQAQTEELRADRRRIWLDSHVSYLFITVISSDQFGFG